MMLGPAPSPEVPLVPPSISGSSVVEVAQALMQSDGPHEPVVAAKHAVD
jgi:hypothetical protein